MNKYDWMYWALMVANGFAFYAIGRVQGFFKGVRNGKQRTHAKQAKPRR